MISLRWKGTDLHSSGAGYAEACIFKGAHLVCKRRNADLRRRIRSPRLQGRSRASRAVYRGLAVWILIDREAEIGGGKIQLPACRCRVFERGSGEYGNGSATLSVGRDQRRSDRGIDLNENQES